MRPASRIALATLLAPLAVTLCVLSAAWWSNGFSGLAQELRVAAGFLPLTYLPGLAVTVVLGLPAFAVYRRFGWTHPVGYALGGAAMGLAGGIAVLAVLLADAFRPGSAWSFPPLAGSIIFALSGALAALLFWSIAVRPLR